MIHIVNESSTNHGTAHKSRGTAHKNERQTADVLVHISRQIWKCWPKDSNAYSLKFKMRRALNLQPLNWCLFKWWHFHNKEWEAGIAM